MTEYPAAERSIFLSALACSPADRAAYLDRACGGDGRLRAGVEGLLAAHDRLGAAPAGTPGDDTRTGPDAANDGEPFDFLEPSDRPDSLGRLGHYEVLEVVGRGGMGVVLRAFDEKLHRIVAVKVMAAPLATSATARKRFTREARAAAAVTHDHIVTIHAVEEAAGLPYLVMQYVDGVSLQERIDRGGPLEPREVVRVGMQAAAGLAAAHAHGLIHRDIKPANILLENGVERVKLTDFGLARAAADASLTQSGAVAGTPQYMSPEQARGEAVDHRSDLFSLGSVLYAMCTGRPPFRSATGVAVLKCVCDDTPSPITETNPDIPRWLTDLVARLHAKDPADRLQSAAEVAGVLKDHLARLQHPSTVGPVAGDRPSAPGGGGPAGRPAGRRRWVVAAAAVLLCSASGMGLAEATGRTNLRAAVIRVFTPDGTLVVEVDDPGVKVTVEGDGGLVIAGAGLQEVRLRPGGYTVRATKDGKVVREELVTITRGDTRVVRVSHEAAASPAAASTGKQADRPFVVLTGEGAAVRSYDTLAEAVHGAADRDTIEVRGNGPFMSGSVIIGQALTIRAAPGFRPVLKRDDGAAEPDAWLRSDASLVLEGLELREASGKPADFVWSSGGSLHVANCRFVTTQKPGIFWEHFEPAGRPGGVCEVRNCEFACVDCSPLQWVPHNGCRLVVDNNVMVAAGRANVLTFGLQKTDVRDASMEIRRSTLTGPTPLGFTLWGLPLGAKQARHWIRVETAGNVLEWRYAVFHVGQAESTFEGGKPFAPRVAEALLLGLFDWHDQQNVYSGPFRGVIMDVPLPSLNTLADWQRFWKTGETDALEGRVRFQGGDLIAKAARTPEQVTADDFRLRPDSAGYRAGKDSKDLGADIDLVGPGPAYERWTKTPAYQQWLTDTKQAKK